MEFGGGRNDGGHSSHNLSEEQSEKATTNYYECTFCKRGFTNAQALGGHMNIHRKDRSKTKSKVPKSKRKPTSTDPLNCTSSSISTSQAEIEHHGYMNKSSSCLTNLGSGSENSLYYSHMFYCCPPPPLLPPCNPNPNTHLGFHGGDFTSDLSLQIGSSRTRLHLDNDKDMVDADEDNVGVVDLELRLGRPSQP